MRQVIYYPNQGSKVQRFKGSKVRRFKGSKVRGLESSTVRKFTPDSKRLTHLNLEPLNLEPFGVAQISWTPVPLRGILGVHDAEATTAIPARVPAAPR